MLSANRTLDMTPDWNGISHHENSWQHQWEIAGDGMGTPSKSGWHSAHIHPKAKESYSVIEGQLEVNINGKWQLLQQGQEITVTEGTPHTFRNPANSITRVYNTHSPAMRFDEYFERLNNIVAMLSHGRKEKLKTNFNVATHLSMLMKKYKEEIVSVNPPNFLVSLLNAIGKMRGLKV